MADEQPPKPPKRKRRGAAAKQAKAKQAEVAVERRREKATQLKIAGWSYRDIAGHLKVSVGTVCGDINAVLDRTIDKSDDRIARARAVKLARLEKAVKALWAAVEDGDLEAITTLVRLEREIARASGTDAPKHLEVSGPEGAPIPVDDRSSLLERLAGLIAGQAPAGAKSEDNREPERGGGEAPQT